MNLIKKLGWVVLLMAVALIAYRFGMENKQAQTDKTISSSISVFCGGTGSPLQCSYFTSDGTMVTKPQFDGGLFNSIGNFDDNGLAIG